MKNIFSLRIICICLCLLITGVLPCVRGTTVNVGRVRVSYLDKWPVIKKGGYFPVVMKLYNTSENTIVVEVHGKDKYRVDFFRQVELEPLEREFITLQVGHFLNRESHGIGQYELTVSAGRFEEELNLDIKRQHSYQGNRYTIVFIAGKKPGLMGVFENTFTMGESSYSREPYIGLVPPDWLPEGWISYSGIDFAMIDAGAIRNISPERGADIEKWVRAGGTVVCYNTEVISQKLGQRAFPDLLSGLDTAEFKTLIPKGRGNIVLLKGFPDNEKKWDRVRVLGLSRDISIADTMGIPRLNIPGVGDIPVKGFLTIIILFSIIIGPVNILYFKLKKRDIIVLVTIPLIAGFSGLFLYIYSFISEGVVKKMIVMSATEIDPEHRMSYTDSAFSIYNSTFTKKEFSLTPDDMLLKKGYIVDSGASIMFGRGSVVYKNFVPQRIIQSFRARNITSARERISVEKDSDKIWFLNGLGTVVKFAVINYRGVCYSVKKVEDGERIQMRRYSKQSIPPLLTYGSGRFSSLEEERLAMHIENFAASGIDDNRMGPKKGFFIAVVQKNRLMKPLLNDYDEVGSFHMVYGKY